MSPEAVLDFWFGAPGSAEHGRAREIWFRKSQATDGLIRERFGSTVEAALRGELDQWAASARGTLALIVVLDQFTRNIFRDSARAFAGDAAALRAARSLVGSGDDLRFALHERWFAYTPFEHSESLTDQRESVRLFNGLAEAGLAEPLRWAIRHCEVIERFGRFPHRNALLGRSSTAEELAFLKQPGSRF